MNDRPGYLPQADRKKILLLCDDVRFFSGIATIARNLVINTSHRYNWCQLAGSTNHPEAGKRFDLSQETNRIRDINDSYIMIYPINGYGDPNIVRQVMGIEKPDMIMLFTDPRYWIWFFHMENEIRYKIPVIYLSIWDDAPAPLYNFPFYASCDLLMNISKQTLNLTKQILTWGDHPYEELSLN